MKPNPYFDMIIEEANKRAVQAVTDFVSRYGEPFFCGFAWVKLPDGRDPFAKYVKVKGIAHEGYPKGTEISLYKIPGMINTQSMAIKEVAAKAYVEVLGEYGIKAMVHSRAD